MRGPSARREAQVSHNSCRRLPVGTASLTRSSQSRRCGIRLLTYENCSTDLAILVWRRQPTMQVQAEVSAWLTTHRALPAETRNYVALVTGWTADEWASSSPPEKAATTIPQGVPCTRLANLILAPKQERQRRRLHTALGHSTGSSFVRKHGLGHLS